MKKISIAAASVIIVIIALLFMAQSCEEGGYPSYAGDWYTIERIPTEGGPYPLKYEISLQEDSWQINVYSEGEPWDYLFGLNGSLEMNGDAITMVISGVRLPEPNYDWYDKYDVECPEGCSGPFYSALQSLFYSYYYWGLEDYMSWYYSYYSTNPQILGSIAVSSTGSHLFVSMEYGEIFEEWYEGTLEFPDEVYVFTKK
jgi:hypothetical protein